MSFMKKGVAEENIKKFADFFKINKEKKPEIFINQTYNCKEEDEKDTGKMKEEIKQG